MPKRDTLKEELKLLHQLQPLVTAKQEIAVTRIRDPRVKVLAARTFFEHLTEVFGRVREAYQNEVARLRDERKGHAVVLFSTDVRLTGPITTATFRHFVSFLELHHADPVIIGSVAKERLSRELPDVEFKYLQLPSQQKEQTEHIYTLMKQLIAYKRITFIYGRYNNLIDQKPVHITVGDKAQEQEGGQVQEHYFFEPSLEVIVKFFDQNLIALLLRQTANESELAELGSQVTAMERADVNITLRLQELFWKDRRQNRQRSNKKQRERMAGMRLWVGRV